MEESRIKIDVEKFLTDGYYVGDIEEIFDDIELFNKNCDEICEFGKNRENRFLKKFQYRFQYPEADREGKPHQVFSFEEIEERDEHIKKNGFRTIQRWWERPAGGELEKYTKYFRNNVDKFLPKLYPDLDDNIQHHDAFTLYENGDFIERHYDGRSTDRNCVILIYLSDPKDYNDGGGKLIVGKKDEELHSVDPLRNKFVIMDFTKHDIIHEVEPVKNDFQRNTYITFVYNEEMYFINEF
jgi:hypothetical protein